MQECNALGRKLLELIGDHLGLEKSSQGRDYFSSKHDIGRMAKSSSVVRLLHYVPGGGATAAEKARALDDPQGEVRCGCHSDYGSLTFLFQDDVGGLQVLRPRSSADEERSFINVLPVEGCVVVNCGDLMQFWTDSYCRSAQHRVVTPRDPLTGQLRHVERFSFAYFMHPVDDMVIVPVHSAKTKAPVHEWPDARKFEHRRMEKMAAQLGPRFTAIEYAYGRLASTYK
jgi:isopenicillin N synthase-like dioxygenase